MLKYICVFQGLKCRNNDEKSRDEFTEVAIVCMYNMSNWDRPAMKNKGNNNGNRNNNNQNSKEDNRSSYNNQNMYNRDNNQDSTYNNNRNYNKYNQDNSDSGYGFRNWRRQQTSRGIDK